MITRRELLMGIAALPISTKAILDLDTDQWIARERETKRDGGFLYSDELSDNLRLGAMPFTRFRQFRDAEERDLTINREPMGAWQ